MRAAIGSTMPDGGTTEFCDSDQMHQFFKAHYLHWLEALDLISNISEGVAMIRAY